LVGGLVKPLQRFGIVLRNAIAVLVNPPETILGEGNPLVGGLAKPLQRFGIVLRNAPPV
jgi:hypothetical protein